MATKSITTRISLDGGETIIRQLAELGDTGKKAFDNIKSSADKVGDIKPNFEEVKQSLREVEQVGTGAFDRIRDAAASLGSKSVVAAVSKISSDLGSLVAPASGVIASLAAVGQAVTDVGSASDKADQNLTKTNLAFVGLGGGAGRLVALLPRAALLLGGTAAAAAGLGVAVVAVGKRSAEAAVDIGRAADRAGLSVEGYQQAQFALEQLGLKAPEAEKALDTFGKSTEEAAKKGEEALKKLGLSFAPTEAGAKAAADVLAGMATSASNTKPPIDAVTAALGAAAKAVEATKNEADGGGAALKFFAEMISRVRDPTVQADIVNKAFGETIGRILLPRLREGSAGIEKFLADQKKIGANLTDEQRKQADEFDRVMKRFTFAQGQAREQLGLLFVPLATSLVETTTDLIAKARVAGSKILEQLKPREGENAFDWISRQFNDAVAAVQEKLKGTRFEVQPQESAFDWLKRQAAAVIGDVQEKLKGTRFEVQSGEGAFDWLKRQADAVIGDVQERLKGTRFEVQPGEGAFDWLKRQANDALAAVQEKLKGTRFEVQPQESAFDWLSRQVNDALTAAQEKLKSTRFEVQPGEGAFAWLRRQFDDAVAAVQEKLKATRFQIRPEDIGAALKFDELKNAITEKLRGFAPDLVAQLEDIKARAQPKLQELKDLAAKSFDDLRSTVLNAVSNLGAELGPKWDDLKAQAGPKLQALKDLVAQKFDELKTAITAGNFSAELGPKLDELKSAAAPKIEELKNLAVQKFQELKSAVVAAVSDLAAELGPKWEQLKADATPALDALRNLATEKWEQIRAGIGSKLDELNSTVAEKWEQLKADAGPKLEELASFAAEKFEQIRSAIAAKLGEIQSSPAWQQIAERGRAAFDAISGGVERAGETIASAFSAAVEPVRSFATDSIATFNDLKTAINSIPDPGEILINGLRSVASAIDGVIRQVGRTIADLGGAPNEAEQNLRTLKDDITQILSDFDAGKPIKDSLQAVPQAVQPAINQVKQDITSIGEVRISTSPFDAIIAAINKITEAAREAARNVANISVPSSGGGGGGGGEDIGGFAAGGSVRGPGSSTSDSILAWLSTGEFVIKASAVAQLIRQHGAGILALINRGQLPRLSAGGFADSINRSLASLRLPGFAAGGLPVPAAAAAGGPTFNLVIGGERFVGLSAPSDEFARLERLAVLAGVRSAGRKPSSY